MYGRLKLDDTGLAWPEGHGRFWLLELPGQAKTNNDGWHGLSLNTQK
jgi:hypothetical protein